jgi:ABC-type multidrug transport system ATPase subunit
MAHPVPIGRATARRAASILRSRVLAIHLHDVQAVPVHPPDKEVLKDISLSFMPGAKIGVLGLNGSGKSTLLRIMAGLDHDYRGDAQLAPGATVGLLSQEPQLDETKDVRGNVEEAVAETRALLDRFNELASNYSEETADEFGRLQEQIDAADAWNLDTMLDTAMDALRLPPSDADVSRLSGGERRRVALCRLLLRAPDLLLLDEPTNHLDAESVGWLERHLEDYKGTSSRSPTIATSSTTSRAGSSSSTAATGCRSRATTRAGSSRSRSGSRRRRAGVRPPAHDRAGARVGPREPEGPAQEGQGAPQQLRAPAREERNVKLDSVQIHIPPARGSATWSSRPPA